MHVKQMPVICKWIEVSQKNHHLLLFSPSNLQETACLEDNSPLVCVEKMPVIEIVIGAQGVLNTIHWVVIDSLQRGRLAGCLF